MLTKKSVTINGLSLGAAGLLLAGAASVWAGEPFDEFGPLIEINATDGDVGFHTLLDGPAWKTAKLYDSDWDRMLKVRGTDDLDEQGLTEIFFESAEPLCWDDGSGDEVVTLEEFLDRFEAGTYRARGRTLDNERLYADAELTHNLPGAPVVEVVVEFEDGDIDVELSWNVGSDLGECLYPAGLIPDPASVPVVRWEIVVEPDEDQIPEGVAFSKFSAQVPGHISELQVSEEFIEAFTELGVDTFKYEVGAKEASGNQTFTEGEFEIEIPD